MNKEEKILTLIKASAATIKTTAGYSTNIGSYVQEWLGEVYSETANEAMEIRDVNGEPDDEFEPTQRELLTVEFAVGCKKGSSTAAYLRKVKADIYKMVGASLASWRSAVDASITVERGSFEKDIQRGKEIYGEMTVQIIVGYYFDEWLQNEPSY